MYSKHCNKHPHFNKHPTPCPPNLSLQTIIPFERPTPHWSQHQLHICDESLSALLYTVLSRCENFTQPADGRCENFTQPHSACMSLSWPTAIEGTFTNWSSRKIVLIIAHPLPYPAGSLTKAWAFITAFTVPVYHGATNIWISKMSSWSLVEMRWLFNCIY